MAFREGDDGLLHFDWDVNIARSFTRSRGAAPDLWPFFRGLNPIPLLVFRGDASDVLSDECFARMGREYPIARLVAVSNTGHAPTLTEPECVVALDEFLNAV